MKKWAFIVFLVLGIGLSESFAQSDSSAFYISPNPVEDDVTLRINYAGKDIKGVRIYDIIGKEVSFIDLTGKAGRTELTIDISALRPGIYFCNLYSDRGIIESRKMIKNK
ncbi:MAG: T9SS type A sorting domain-containing protein [Cytophagales bacterium]|nr:T9SS type A sorting domain-containing protein [Cytophaga sp.]